MLHVQQYLETHDLEDLETEFGITYKEYPEKDCVILNYSQINSPKTNDIVRECRGLVLQGSTHRVLCKPFTRFFNYGEDHEGQAEFSFDRAHVLSKEDGTLVSFWYHPTEGWVCSTRKMAFAEGPINSVLSDTFRDAIMKCFGCVPSKDDFDRFFGEHSRQYTWSFEFVSPENRIVTSYGSDYSLYFLACHHNESGEYLQDGRSRFEHLQEHDRLFSFVRFPKEYDLRSYQQIVQFLTTLDDTDEGFVCYDPDSDIRVKIKNPRYLLISSMRCNGMITVAKIVELIASHEDSEYLTYFESDRALFEPWQRGYERLVSDVESVWDTKFSKMEYSTPADRKAYALEALNTDFSFILFQLKKSDCDGSIRTVLSKSTIDKLVDLVHARV